MFITVLITQVSDKGPLVTECKSPLHSVTNEPLSKRAMPAGFMNSPF